MTKTPMDTVTSGFSLRSILDMNISYQDMVEIGLFLNEIYYILDPSRVEYKRKCVPEVHEKDIGNYLSLILTIIQGIEEKGQHVELDVVTVDKKRKWAELKGTIYSRRTVPDMDGYVMTYLGEIICQQSKNSKLDFSELYNDDIMPCIEAAIIANEVLSYQLSYNTDLAAKYMFEESYGFTQENILDMVDMLKQEFLENTDYEDIVDKLSNPEMDDGFLYEHIRFMMSSADIKPKDILEEYRKEKHFHLRKEVLIERVSHLCSMYTKVNIKVIRFAQRKLTEALKKCPYPRRSKDYRRVERLFNYMKEAMDKAHNEIPEFPDIDMETCCLSSQTTAGEIYREFYGNYFVMMDMMWVDLIGLTNHEERLMQCGVEIPTDIAIRSWDVIKPYRKELKIINNINSDMTSFLMYLDIVSKVRDNYFDNINKLKYEA